MIELGHAAAAHITVLGTDGTHKVAVHAVVGRPRRLELAVNDNARIVGGQGVHGDESVALPIARHNRQVFGRHALGAVIVIVGDVEAAGISEGAENVGDDGKGL